MAVTMSKSLLRTIYNDRTMSERRDMLGHANIFRDPRVTLRIFYAKRTRIHTHLVWTLRQLVQSEIAPNRIPTTLRTSRGWNFSPRVRLHSRKEEESMTNQDDEKRDMRIMWIASAAIVLFILGAMGINMLVHHDTSTGPTDISSQSRPVAE
jgi:hypothetical protein